MLQIWSLCLVLNFNSDVTAWDTKNVTIFKFMFKECFQFNYNIGNWNFSSLANANNVTDIYRNTNMLLRHIVIS